MAGCIIAKLPQTLTDFATSLKLKRQEFGIADLIGSLDVEEKARAKDVHGKKIVEANSSAHVVQKGPQNSHKKKFKQELKQKNTTPFKKKKKNQQNKGAILAVSRDTTPQNARRARIGPRNLQT